MVEKTSEQRSGLDSLLDKTSKKGLKVQAYNRVTEKVEEVTLDYLHSLRLKLSGSTEIGERRYEGWLGSIPFYIYTCKSKGKKIFMLDYPHGFEERLDCEL